MRQQNNAEHGLVAAGGRSKQAFKRDRALPDPGSGLSPQDKLAETIELIQVKTAATGVTLQRLAELGDKLDRRERQDLLVIARTAANVASKAYARVCRTRPKAPLARMLERNVELPFAEVQDYGEYLRCLQWQARMRCLGRWNLEAWKPM